MCCQVEAVHALGSWAVRGLGWWPWVGNGRGTLGFTASDREGVEAADGAYEGRGRGMDSALMDMHGLMFFGGVGPTRGM